MAGFSGMPLGSFSGRGADFQPFQFIMQLRQRQAEQEQARKEQAQAAQQSFLMAVMSQKQQQQQMQQRQQEAMMQRSLEEQNQARLADQFRSEQSRLQGAEQRRIEMERAQMEQQAALRAKALEAESQDAGLRRAEAQQGIDLRKSAEQRQQAEFEYEKSRRGADVDAKARKEADARLMSEVQAVAEREASSYREGYPTIPWAEAEDFYRRRAAVLFKGDEPKQRAFVENARQYYATRAKTALPQVKAQLAAIDKRIERLKEDYDSAAFRGDAKKAGTIEKEVQRLETEEAELLKQLAAAE